MNRTLGLSLVLLLCARSQLGAVEATVVVGTWVVDTDATWEHLKKMPEVSALTAEQIPQVKATFDEQFKSTRFEFTDDKLTSVVNGEKKEESYRVAKIDGESIFTDDTASDGKVTHSRIDVKGDRLEIVNLGAPAEVIVLKHDEGAAPAK